MCRDKLWPQFIAEVHISADLWRHLLHTPIQNHLLVVGVDLQHQCRGIAALPAEGLPCVHNTRTHPECRAGASHSLAGSRETSLGYS